MLALALALTLAPPEMHRGVVVSSSGGWIEIDIGGAHTFFFTFVEGLAPPTTRSGDRVRFVAQQDHVILSIRVVLPDPVAMDAAVEEWVAECRGARAWNVLDASDLAAVERLGAPCWQIREAATKTIRERGPGAFRSLIWARRSGDPEVRMRAGVILDELGWRLSSCP